MNSEIRSIRSNGKLLFSAEYFVLFGAKALALPTSFGHELVIKSKDTDQGFFSWTTKVCGEHVLTAKFSHLGKAMASSNYQLSERLESIFNVMLQIKGKQVFHAVSEFQSNLEFSMKWGLGSSSTLIHGLASWANIDPFILQKEVFKGSGYDIACAGSNEAILYELKDKTPTWSNSTFNPPFKKDLFFVYLNKKENSRQAISLSESRKKLFSSDRINRISDISVAMSEAKRLETFSELMTEHESIVSEVIGKESVKANLFQDYPNSIKSLGAWGGDFILVEGDSSMYEYFQKKGYETCFSYDEMILNLH